MPFRERDARHAAHDLAQVVLGEFVREPEGHVLVARGELGERLEGGREVAVGGKHPHTTAMTTTR